MYGEKTGTLNVGDTITTKKYGRWTPAAHATKTLQFLETPEGKRLAENAIGFWSGNKASALKVVIMRATRVRRNDRLDAIVEEIAPKFDAFIEEYKRD